MTNINQIMQQAQQMQAKMAEMQAQLDLVEIHSQAGGDLVKVTVNGKSDLLKLTINPNIVNPDDVETLEDLITAAVNSAKQQVESHIQGETQKIMRELGLPEDGLPG